MEKILVKKSLENILVRHRNTYFTATPKIRTMYQDGNYNIPEKYQLKLFFYGCIVSKPTRAQGLFNYFYCGC